MRNTLVLLEVIPSWHVSVSLLCTTTPHSSCFSTYERYVKISSLTFVIARMIHDDVPATRIKIGSQSISRIVQAWGQLIIPTFGRMRSWISAIKAKISIDFSNAAEFMKIDFNSNTRIVWYSRKDFS